MTSILALIILNYLFLLAAAVAALLLGATFSRSQRARFAVIRRLDGRQVTLTLTSLLCLAAGYSAYAVKEIQILRLSFKIAPGPSTSQVVFATSTGLDLELLQSASEQASLARDAFASGEARFRQGDYPAAAAAFKRSSDAMPTLSALFNEGLALRYVPDYPAAELTLRQCVAKAIQHHRDVFEAHCNLYLSSVLLGENRNELAERHVACALNIYERLGDQLGQANCHLNQGNIAAQRLARADALREWERALDGFNKTGNALGKGNAYSNLAGLFAEDLRLDEATDAVRSAITSYHVAQNKSGLARAHAELAALLMGQGRPQEALSVAREALSYAQRQGDQDLRCYAFGVFGAIYDELGMFDQAVASDLAAIKLAIDTGHLQQAIWPHYYLACSYRQQRRLLESRQEAEVVTKLAAHGAPPLVVAAAWTEIALTYVDACDFPRARYAIERAQSVGSGRFGDAAASAARGILEAKAGNCRGARPYLTNASTIFSAAGLNTRLARDVRDTLKRCVGGGPVTADECSINRSRLTSQ